MTEKLTYEELEQRIAMLENESVKQKRIGNLIREDKKILQAFLDIPNAIALLIDRNAILLYANETIAKRFNTDVSKLIGRCLWDLFPTDVCEKRRLGYKTVLQDKKQIRYEDERQGIWSESIITPILDELGEVEKIAVVGFDITERKQAEKALIKSEEQYQAVSKITSDYAYAFRVEPDGNIVNEWVTGALKRITGFSEEEVRKKGGWESLIHPDDLHIPMEQLKLLFSNQSKTVEYRIIDKEGNNRWMKDFSKPIWDKKNNRLKKIYGAVQEITNQKMAEEELRDNEERYRSLFENNPIETIAVDKEARVTEYNLSKKMAGGGAAKYWRCHV